MEISQITDIIIAAAPAITAVIGIIISLVAGIKRIKQANRDTLEEIKDKNAQLMKNVAEIAQNNVDLARENAELKEDLREVMCHIKKIEFKEIKKK